jgi:DNA-binding GntR family transcriptional regulator
MTKKHLTLLVEAGLIQKAKDHGLIISRFLENKLQEYFSFIDMVSKPSIQHRRLKADLSGFEPESEAPEASVISKLHYRPKTIRLI